MSLRGARHRHSAHPIHFKNPTGEIFHVDLQFVYKHLFNTTAYWVLGTIFADREQLALPALSGALEPGAVASQGACWDCRTSVPTPPPNLLNQSLPLTWSPGAWGTYTLLTWGCLGFEEGGTSLAKCSDPSGYVFVWGWGWNQKRMGQLQGWLEGGQYKTPLSSYDPESTVRPANKRSRQSSNYQPYHR